jgi:hypothetical protein
LQNLESPIDQSGLEARDVFYEARAEFATDPDTIRKFGVPEKRAVEKFIFLLRKYFFCLAKLAKYFKFSAS